MVKELLLYNDLRKTQTLLNCLETSMLDITAGSKLNDKALESFDLLYLLLDHVGRMMDKAGKGQISVCFYRKDLKNPLCSFYLPS